MVQQLNVEIDIIYVLFVGSEEFFLSIFYITYNKRFTI